MTYTVADTNGATSEPATLTVTVRQNRAPATVDDAGTTDENTVLTVANDAAATTTNYIIVTDPDTGDTGTLTITGNADLLLNDTDPDGDTLTITGVNGAAANVGTAVDGSRGGSFTIRDDGSWEFRPRRRL